MAGTSSPVASVPTALGKLGKEERTEYWAALALRHTKGLGPRSICRLLKHFGSAYGAIEHIPQWDRAGVSPKRSQGVSANTWRATARPEWESCRDLDGHLIVWTNPLYPSLLRELPDAPAFLYARGDLSLLANHCVAVVGSRICSSHKVHLSGQIAAELSASGITVVSGMARGIDTAAHQAALPQVGSTIAVLGAGLDIIYPPENRDLYLMLGQKGLLLTEFAPGTLPDGRHFPIRNRIISGLSHGVLVAEAARRSGSLVTARLALEQNRAVYTIPSRPYEQLPEEELDGCELLLTQGAKPCHNAQEILEDLLPLLAHVPTSPTVAPWKAEEEHMPSHVPQVSQLVVEPPATAPLEEHILYILMGHGPAIPDDIAQLLPCQCETGTLSAALVMLEIQGKVRRLPGMRYEATV